jgi:glycosyltransferase involved in cell wall biosynthesis
MDEPLVSIVITTRNEARNIGRCLEAVSHQTWPNIEVIVVDNKSDDQTKDISRRYTSLVFDKGPERSAQRNHGLAEVATGKYGMFLDADMIITPNLVESCVHMMMTTDVVALHIEEKVLGRGYLAAVRRFERSFYSGTVVDGVRFFDRQTFVDIGGFDETLPPGPEDWDLDKKFKRVGKVELLPSVGDAAQWPMADFVNTRGVKHLSRFVGLYHNEDEQSLARYLSKKSYYSGSMKTYVDKWPNDPDVAKQLGLTYRFFGVFLEDGKWRQLLGHPLLTAGMYSLRVLVGAQYIIKRRGDA